MVFVTFCSAVCLSVSHMLTWWEQKMGLDFCVPSTPVNSVWSVAVFSKCLLDVTFHVCYSLLCGPQTVLVFINYQHWCLKGKLDTCHPNLICACVHVCMLSHVQLFVMPWSVPHQVPLSMGFSWQEYWSGASLVVWWLRILLAMQETLIQEDPTCHGQLSPCSATR